MEKLEIVGGIEIPLKMPVSQQYPVVFCIAPSSQDSTLNWPDLIFQIHVSRYYGAHLHFYLTNVSSPIYDFLKIYQSQKYITLQPWLKTSNSTDGAVYTDCLLQYKDATDYIGFMGPNEILIPSGASSYYEEFMREFGGNDEISSLKYEQYLLEAERVNVNGRGPGHRVTKRVHNGIFRLENQKIDKMLIQNFGIPKAIRRDIPLLRIDQIAEVEKDWERIRNSSSEVFTRLQAFASCSPKNPDKYPECLGSQDSLLCGNHEHAIDLIENTSTIRLLHVESSLGQRVQHDFFGDVEAREFAASKTTPGLLEDSSVDHVAAWLDGGAGVLDG
ncbi:hypothetical protein GCK72_016857 [Caenorhabditis remanei]|uniref:Glycosyltransferase family 92 protein n=1 Tax=Caenorhabditis remanei TaxID=31234 RepID=A0A6A5G752_CAERE|nr:hypothetical protein GCK72_016857 [Caenorhabditis remanei]KAF1750309.1 hypothetical protein GCK72_016857 [Caenorhabditis remanei]